MRPAIYSTENPPVSIDCLETQAYITSLRRRIELQLDGMESLAAQVYSLKGKVAHFETEVEKLSLDLGIKDQTVDAAWQKVMP
jgi:hypothetical protein